MPKNAEALALVRRRHPEWREHQLRWRWLLDSLEGGERYRQAVYGLDGRGLPVRNLIRHKREYPDPREAGGSSNLIGADPAAPATDDDYELRRARTPIPTFVAEAVETHLARIYSREVKRNGPDPLAAWWADVEGTGTTMDQWMAGTVAPLLLTLGQLDLHFDHPPAPEGERIETRADVERLGLDACLASVILPQHMLWWRLDPTGRRYEECLVLEPGEAPEYEGVGLGLGLRHEPSGGPRYRHWTAEGSTLYDEDGEILQSAPHPFSRVPIARVFDNRKSRCRNIGQPRYEGVAERQREYYNRDSELILSDTTQAHPLLQGPEDFLQADGTVPVGPTWLLPKKKNIAGSSVSYEGFDVIGFPKDGADSLRKNKADIRADVDRETALIRPSGTTGPAQSGLAKLIDHADGNGRLAKIGQMLGRAERVAAELALTVLGDGPPPTGALAEIEVAYPAEFDLYTATDVAGAAADFQAIAARAGALPAVEALLLGRLLRLCLPGLGDAHYAACDAELATYLAARSRAIAGESGLALES